MVERSEILNTKLTICYTFAKRRWFFWGFSLLLHYHSTNIYPLPNADSGSRSPTVPTTELDTFTKALEFSLGCCYLGQLICHFIEEKTKANKIICPRVDEGDSVQTGLSDSHSHDLFIILHTFYFNSNLFCYQELSSSACFLSYSVF